MMGCQLRKRRKGERREGGQRVKMDIKTNEMDGSR